MKCDDMPQQLVSLLYGDATKEEEQQIQSHLKTCTSCMKIFQELKNTSNLLEKWEDVTPNMNFVFVREPSSRWKTWLTTFQQTEWKKRLLFGVPAVAVLLLISLALFNFRASYRDGQWQVAFSLLPQRSTENQETQFIEALNQSQNETLRLVSQLISESEYRQNRESALTLAQFAQDMEKQRQNDLLMLGKGLEGLHQTTEGRFNQTNNVLNDLIRLTSLKVER